MENSQLTSWLVVHSHPAIGSFYSVFLTLDLTNAVNGPSIPFLFFPAQPRNRTPLTSILLSLPALGHQPHTSNPLSSLHRASPLRPAASSTAWLRTRGTGRIRPGTAAPYGQARFVAEIDPAVGRARGRLCIDLAAAEELMHLMRRRRPGSLPVGNTAVASPSSHCSTTAGRHSLGQKSTPPLPAPRLRDFQPMGKEVALGRGRPPWKEARLLRGMRFCGQRRRLRVDVGGYREIAADLLLHCGADQALW
jgi:hypothetical protein